MSEVFQAAKHTLNDITSAIALAVEGIWLLAIGLIGDDRPDLCPYEPSPPMVCVIGLVGEGVKVRGALVRMGCSAVDREQWDWSQVDRNPFFCPDAEKAKRWADDLDRVRKEGSSIGGVVEIVASGVPPGLGEPIFDRLDADLGKAILSIPAVKGVEIGKGFEAATLSGPENADPMRVDENGDITFLSNNAGGTLGGISTGQNIVVRAAIKPTSSIPTPQPTVTRSGRNTEIVTKGRHDPCVAIRGVPVGEAMVALTLADHLLRFRAQCGAP